MYDNTRVSLPPWSIAGILKSQHTTQAQARSVAGHGCEVLCVCAYRAEIDECIYTRNYIFMYTYICIHILYIYVYIYLYEIYVSKYMYIYIYLYIYIFIGKSARRRGACVRGAVAHERDARKLECRSPQALSRVQVCCSVLQCVVVCCSVL